MKKIAKFLNKNSTSKNFLKIISGNQTLKMSKSDDQEPNEFMT